MSEPTQLPEAPAHPESFETLLLCVEPEYHDVTMRLVRLMVNRAFSEGRVSGLTEARDHVANMLPPALLTRR